MQYLRVTGRNGDEAVSPVVGVMLMLVVVIIIAAVVSGFAGGMVGDAGQKAPILAMDVKVINMGSWTGSGFYATVTGVSKPIDTADLRIVTSWTAANGGVPVSGGNTTLPRVLNTNILYGSLLYGGFSTNKYPWVAPWGGGPGINGSTTIGFVDQNAETYEGRWQQFGYYTLIPGTTMTCKAWGQSLPRNLGGSAGTSSTTGYGVATPYTYTYAYTDGRERDAMMTVLGHNWELLREGDKVNIKVIHIPTGKVIFNKDVPVTEG